MGKEKISVIIPCYYSEQTITPIVKKVKDVLEKEGFEYEIILIDDGSKDNTYTKIEALAEKDKSIKGVQFSQNYGQHAALHAGYSFVTGDIVIGLNDDGEQDPEDIPKLIVKIREGYDYVCSKRQVKKHSLVQNLGSKFNNFCLIHLLGQPKDFYFSSYYAMNRFLINEIVKNKNPFVNINGLILSITKNVADVEIPAYERKIGKSGYSLKKSILLWANSFTAFSTAPLRISFYIGALLAMSGLLLIGYFIISIVLSSLLAAFWSLGIGILLEIFSLIFFALGIMGEFVGRIYMVVNGKQQYIIRKISNIE